MERNKEGEGFISLINIFYNLENKLIKEKTSCYPL